MEETRCENFIPILAARLFGGSRFRAGLAYKLTGIFPVGWSILDLCRCNSWKGERRKKRHNGGIKKIRVSTGQENPKKNTRK